MQFQLDNDGLNFWRHPARRPDGEYTNGVRMAVELGRAPLWGRWARGSRACAEVRESAPRCLSTLITIGQEMYTPAEDRQPYSYPQWREQRPYAGWLYAGVTARSVRENDARALGLTLGVTGPPSLAGAVQIKAHEMMSEFTTIPVGWETQVGFEPGVMLTAHQQRMLFSGTVRGLRFVDGSVGVGGSLGNILTSADVDARIRGGFNLSHPWRRARHRGAVELVGSVGVRGRAIARSIFLDGNTVRPERRVERVPFVADEFHVLGVRFGSFAVSYRVNRRSQEYRTGPRSHTFSSIVLGVGGNSDAVP